MPDRAARLRAPFAAALLLHALAAVAGRAAAADDPLADVRALQSAARWAASESLATAVLGRLGAAPAPDSLAMADAMELIVRSKVQRQAFRDTLAAPLAGRALGIRARRLPAGDARIGDAHYWLAFVLGTSGRVDSAYRHAEASYRIRSRALAPADTSIAESLRLLGLVCRDRSDFRAAADYFGRAFEQRLLAHDENRQVMVRLLAERGNALRRSGDLDGAGEVLRRALALCARALGPDAFECSVPLDYLALVERESGDLAGAIARSQEAIRIARLHFPDDHQNVVRLRRNMSPILDEIGDFAASARLMRSVLPSYERTFGPDHPRTVNARVSLGSALVGAGDSAAAARELETVIEVLSARPGPPDPLIGTAHVWLGELYVSRGDHARARDTFRRGIPVAGAARVPQWLTLAELHLGLVRSRAALGDTAGLEADRLGMLRVAAERAVRHSNIPQNVHRTNARALRALGRADEAWAEALAADRIAHERLLANVRSLPDRRALQLSLRYAPATDLVVDLARDGGPARLPAAWDAVVRARGLVRAEMASRRLPADGRADTALAGAHARWMTAQRRRAKRLVSAAEDPAAGSDAELERLRNAAENAERDFARALAAGGYAPARTEASLAEVLAALAPDQALVGFVETDAAEDARARVSAFVARGGSDRVELVELGSPAEMRGLVEPWLERLATPPGTDPRGAAAAERACRKAGEAVRAAAWDPLAARLAGAREVLLVPDGPLTGLAWEALPDRDGYLVEHGPTLVVLNAEREVLDRPRGPEWGALLAVGAPDFGPAGGARASDTRLPTSPDPCAGGLPALGPLPATAEEVEAVARTWRGAAERLTGAAATEEAFKRAASGREVVHVATHGVVARDTCAAAAPGLRGVGAVRPIEPAAKRPGAKAAAARPAPAAASPWLARRVWLALAGANRAAEHTADENEGLLTAEEVLTLDLEGAEWVVLSACHSGAGEDWSREGALGMRRAFHLAGARSVIASRWSVEDVAARDWMAALYAARAAGRHDAGAAAAEASRAVLASRRAAKRTTHPFYWAAFEATGR